MPEQPIDRILDAAYSCFVRHGMRRTTMDDIAAAAGMSRPAVYQYVRNKDDVFARLASRLFYATVDHAKTLAEADVPVADRLHAVLAAKLELTLRLVQDSPHAAELLDAGARLSGHLVEEFTASMRELLADVLSKAAAAGELDLAGADAAEVAEIVLALNHGLEDGNDEPDRTRSRLRLGVDLIVRGLTGGPART